MSAPSRSILIMSDHVGGDVIDLTSSADEKEAEQCARHDVKRSHQPEASSIVEMTSNRRRAFDGRNDAPTNAHNHKRHNHHEDDEDDDESVEIIGVVPPSPAQHQHQQRVQQQMQQQMHQRKRARLAIPSEQEDRNLAAAIAASQEDETQSNGGISKHPPQQHAAMPRTIIPSFGDDHADDNGVLTHSLLESINNNVLATSAPTSSGAAAAVCSTCTKTHKSPSIHAIHRATSSECSTGEDPPRYSLFPSNPTNECFVHVQQSDKNSCGFRNMQMLLAPLLCVLQSDHSFFSIVPTRSVKAVKTYRSSTISSTQQQQQQQQRQRQCHTETGTVAIPTMLRLQHLLESAWRDGWDPQGARFYNHAIVGKTGKGAQIGAVEVLSVLTYCGIDSTVVQFVRCDASRRWLAPFVHAYFEDRTAHECLVCSDIANVQHYAQRLLKESMQSINDRQTNGRHIRPCNCNRLPIYLQWEGHSVTIVGVQGTLGTSSFGFLVFDPLKDGKRLKQQLDNNCIRSRKSCKPVFLSLQYIQKKNRDCQVVLCSAKSLDYHQRSSRKATMSVLTANKGAVAASRR